ncbi:MAG: YmdB family metallophosphoesterase, partial [Oscillospiraceae bacterium]
MNLIMLGDVVGDGGTGALLSYLPSLKKQYAADTVIVNGENSAQGNGILPASAKKIFDSGADCITTGNHVFKRREIYEILDEESAIIRPINYSNKTPGRGVYIIDRLKYKIAVINLMGVTNMEPLRNPFEAIDEALENIETSTNKNIDEI